VMRQMHGSIWGQGRINHSGAPYQRKAGGPFLKRVARIYSEGASLDVHFSLPPQKKKLTTFLVVTFKHSKSKQRGKNFAVDRGPLAAAGAPMVQPA